ncbi:MAG: hypothetical protein M1380_03130, partial [Chloroflexi bacterium]|nr:hypothetical protein [Chloroflexota bacterium]
MVAVIVVLAGAGAGAYFLVRGDGTPTTAATLVGSSTTSLAGGEAAATSTTGDGATTSTNSTMTTTITSTTSQTVPALTTESSVTSDGTSGSSTEDYLQATDNLVQALNDADARIPELATQINNTAPQVPRYVTDELDSILGQVDAAFT